MFTEYSEYIVQLKAIDKNFSRLCDKHKALDAEIDALVQRKSPTLHVDIERLKKQKLLVKEEAYAILQKALPELDLKQKKNYVDLQTLANMSGVRIRS